MMKKTRKKKQKTKEWNSFSADASATWNVANSFHIATHSRQERNKSAAPPRLL